MTLQESGEMYLETILILGKKNGRVRPVDVAEQLNLSKPAVSKAVSKLREEGYICAGEESGLQLTEIGMQTAARIFERHILLTDILSLIGVDRNTAEKDACRIEHIISEETFEAIKHHLAQFSKDR